MQNTPNGLDRGITGKELLTVKETAQLLSISRTKVFDLLARSELRSLKIGRARRIARSELERFITKATEASLLGTHKS